MKGKRWHAAKNWGRNGSVWPRTPTARTTGNVGGPISPNGSGARSAKITRPTARAGNTSLSNNPMAGPIAGARTACSASPTAKAGSASPWPCGTARIRILKERLFGLTNGQGNHGEDVKECYFYLDATPTYSYCKALYKYPQAEFPYARLIEENQRRSRQDPEFELIDTGIFDGESLLRRHGRVRQGLAERSAHSHHRRQSRAGIGQAASAADRCGSAIPGRGAVLMRALLETHAAANRR